MRFKEKMKPVMDLGHEEEEANRSAGFGKKEKQPETFRVNIFQLHANELYVEVGKVCRHALHTDKKLDVLGNEDVTCLERFRAHEPKVL